MSSREGKSDQHLEGLKVLMKKQIIVQLGLAGASRADIRAIVGGDTSFVASILRRLPKQKKDSK